MSDVATLLDSREIKYLAKGRDYLVHCLNPEHEDNSPSMRIDQISGVFHCFSCGFKGDLFDYFGEEVNENAKQISLLQAKISKMLSTKFLEIPVDAVPFTKEYRGIHPQLLDSFGAFTCHSIEPLRDRIVFPLRNIQGNITSFIGRDLYGGKNKYEIYPKRSTLPVFPPHPEIYKNSLIIVEGIFDALNLIHHGCHNVICAFGTSTLKKTFKQKLAHFKILGVKKWFIMFDGDKAGLTAAKTLEKLMNQEGFNAERIELPEDVDPGDLTEEEVSNLMIGLYGNENSSS